MEEKKEDSVLSAGEKKYISETDTSKEVNHTQKQSKVDGKPSPLCILLRTVPPVWIIQRKKREK